MAQIKLKTGDNKYEYIEDRRLHIGSSQPEESKSKEGDLWLDTDEVGVALQPELPKFSGLVKQTLDNNEVPTFSAAVANEDFQSPLNQVNGILKSNNDRQISQAEANVDYMEPPAFVSQSGASLSIILSHNKFYNLIISANGLLTLNSGLGGAGENADISISHGFIQFEGPATVNFGAFLSIKGSDDISGTTATITKTKLWEFSSLNGYLIIKDWSED